MTETVYTFGKDNVLCGTLTTPEPINKENSLPCFILLNSGLVNQAGPFRLYVELSRELANQHFHTLRFDLSGVGDSPKHRDTRPYNEQIAGDISDALSFVTHEIGIEQFVLMGICTGADNTHKATLADPRIIGAITLDGYAYKSLGYYFRHFAPRILNLNTVFQCVKRILSPKYLAKNYHAMASTLEKKLAEEKENYYWTLPPKETTVSDLKKFVDRQVNQLYIFTDNWSWSYNHKNQLQEMYSQVDFKGLATSVYFDKADHIYTLSSDRKKLISTICNWANKIYLDKT